MDKRVEIFLRTDIYRAYFLPIWKAAPQLERFMGPLCLSMRTSERLTIEFNDIVPLECLSVATFLL